MRNRRARTFPLWPLPAQLILFATFHPRIPFLTICPKRILLLPYVRVQIVPWSAVTSCLHNIGWNTTLQTSHSVGSSTDPGNTRATQVSGNISTKACRFIGLCVPRQWPESLMVPESAKRLVLRGCHPALLPMLERKMNSNSHTTVSLRLCLLLFSGQTSPLTKPQRSEGASLGAPRVPLFPWFSTEAVSDFWPWFLTICSRLQLLLFYFVIGLITIVDSSLHNVLFIFTKPNTTLLCFSIEGRLLGDQQMYGSLQGPWRGKFRVGRRDQWSFCFTFREGCICVHGHSPTSFKSSLKISDVENLKKAWKI